ncbi:IS3 family transposase [Haloferula luteola]
MKRKRRTHSAEFKARVALEALKGIKTINQIAQDEGIHPVQVSQWKKELQERLPEVFASAKSGRDEKEKSERNLSRIERKVGQLVIEKEFLGKKVRGAGDRSQRKAMIEKNHPQLSIRKQSAMLGINRNRLETAERISEEDRAIMRALDELHVRWPVYGARKLVVELRKRGWKVGRKRVRQLMRIMGLAAVVPKPRTSVPDKNHRKYPYLLRDREVTTPDEVGCADITYIPMGRGFAYLVAIMDWHSRAVLSWRISNTADTRFCLEALGEAVKVAGRAPDIFNNDQGCQFTSREWVAAVEETGARVSMDGKGRWMDNIFIERLWRSLKCEDIYLKDYCNLVELEAGVSRWITDYNRERIHQHHDYATPWSVYRPQPGLAEAA